MIIASGIQVDFCRCCHLLTSSVLTSLWSLQSVLLVSSALLLFLSRWPQAPSLVLCEFPMCFSLSIYTALILTDTASSYSSRSPLPLPTKPCWRDFGPSPLQVALLHPCLGCPGCTVMELASQSHYGITHKFLREILPNQIS